MKKRVWKFGVVVTLLAGFALRALTPVGYMPGAPGSGLLFELCPDQLPVGVTLTAIQPSAHHHHHGDSSETQSPPAADQCQIGHLLSSTLAFDFDASIDAAPLPVVATGTFVANTWQSPTRVAWRSRGPPA